MKHDLVAPSPSLRGGVVKFQRNLVRAQELLQNFSVLANILFGKSSSVNHELQIAENPISLTASRGT